VVVDGSAGARRRAVPFARTRQIVLATAVLALTLAGHTSAHGALPSTAGLVLAAMIAGSLTLVATARDRSWAWLFAFLLASQLLLHAVLVVSSGEAHMMYGPEPLLPTGWMAVAHVLASMVAAVLLSRGDAALRAWTNLLRASIGIHLDPCLPIGAQPNAVAPQARWWPVTSERSWDVSRRGPPCPLSA